MRGEHDAQTEREQRLEKNVPGDRELTSYRGVAGGQLNRDPL